ncbi:MAG: hypothetical protein AAGI48_04475 [Verrucomicrobiota bacterium]
MPSQRRITGLCEVAFLEEIMKAEEFAIGLKRPVMVSKESEKPKRRRLKERTKQG